MTIPPAQHDAAEFLASLAGRPPAETHISAVFIGEDTVWKLKKAIQMPFLDFTTLNAREHFLRRELELNQPAAPGLYRDVVGIVRKRDGTLGLGNDHPIEFVLRMAKVPASDFLTEIASNDGLTPTLLDALGDSVATYHARLPPLSGIDFAASMLRIADGNAQSALAAGLPPAAVGSWRQRIARAIEDRRLWFHSRSEFGFIRRCHGDLHLGNICLWQGRPVLFDALEFDEALATIDVGYDLAFLLMDLDHQHARAAANRVMNRYVARTGDADLTAGFPVFLSQRAMIRAHVMAAMGRDATQYLAAAERYLDPVAPMVIAIGGLPGTGKSTLARAVAPHIGPAPGALVLRSDEIRKRLFAVPPEAHLPPEAYTAPSNTATNDALVQQTEAAARIGHIAIADATFLDRNVRDRLKAVAEHSGCPFLGIWLHAPISVLEDRISARIGDASDATAAVLHQAVKTDPGPGDWLPIDATDAQEALHRLNQAMTTKCR